MTSAELLDPLARLRTDEVVVTSMSVVRPWGRRSSHALDFASADSAMGHTADLALGIAMARPDRVVVCLNGDGSMLMGLGTLATVVEARTPNLFLVVVENGTYEITGNQPVPGSGTADLTEMARAAGFPRALRFHDAPGWERELPGLLEDARTAGPTFVGVRVEPGDEGPIGRGDPEEPAYLRVSLAEWSRRFRDSLAGSRPR